MTDKELMIQEIKDGILLTSWHAILQVKDGLRHLGVLDIILNNEEPLEDFFCFRPSILKYQGGSKLLQALIEVQEYWCMSI